jgi:hypothetical protein
MVRRPADEQPSRRARNQCLRQRRPRVRTVEARLDSRILRVIGTADATAEQSAIRRAGYQAVILPDRPGPDGAAGVLFDTPGDAVLDHRSPDHARTLATFTVGADPVRTAFADAYREPSTDGLLTAEPARR